MRRALGTLLPLLLLAAPAAAQTSAAPAPAAAPADAPPQTKATEPEGITWFDGDLDAALAAAKAEGRPVMVDVFATWCGPCHELDRKVFSRRDVAEEAKAHYLAVRVDAEAGAGPEIATRYHVVGFPTVLFLAPDGREIDRVFGYLDPRDFLARMEGYRTGRGTLEALAKEALAHPFDIDLAAEVAFRYAVKGDVVQAKRHYARVFAVRRLLVASPSAPARGAADVSRLGGPADFHRVRRAVELDLAGAQEHVDALIAGAYLTLGKYVYLRGTKDYDAAIRILEALVRRFPDSPEAREAPYQLAVAHLRKGEEAHARRELARYVQRNGGQADAVNAVAWLCFREHALEGWARARAERALKESPGDAGLWDTLAELRAVDDPAGAVAAEERAVAADPDERYYRDQLERFTAAAASRASEAASSDGSGPEAGKAETSETTATKR